MLVCSNFVPFQAVYQHVISSELTPWLVKSKELYSTGEKTLNARSNVQPEVAGQNVPTHVKLHVEQSKMKSHVPNNVYQVVLVTLDKYLITMVSVSKLRIVHVSSKVQNICQENPTCKTATSANVTWVNGNVPTTTVHQTNHVVKTRNSSAANGKRQSLASVCIYQSINIKNQTVADQDVNVLKGSYWMKPLETVSLKTNVHVSTVDVVTKKVKSCVRIATTVNVLEEDGLVQKRSVEVHVMHMVPATLLLSIIINTNSARVVNMSLQEVPLTTHTVSKLPSLMFHVVHTVQFAVNQFQSW